MRPKGQPRYIRVYDNGGETADRYTVLFTGRYRTGPYDSFKYVGMSGDPTGPQGFCQHGESDRIVDQNNWGFPPALGKKNHLGKRVRFEDLPTVCQKVVVQDYIELWDLPEEETWKHYNEHQDQKLAQTIRTLR